MTDNHPRDPAATASDHISDETGGLDTTATHRAAPRNGTRRPLRWMLPLVLAAAVIAVIGIVALTNRDDGDNGRIIAEPSDLSGTSWTLLEGTSAGAVVPIVDGWPITLTFDQSTLGGTAACNGYGGTYAITDPPAITISDLGWTAMGCEPAVQASEQAYLEAFVAVTEIDFAADGSELVLTGPDVELLFGITEPVPTTDLIDQLWLLESLIQGDDVVTAVGEPATLLLRGDGTVEGGTGCRTFEGAYTVFGSEVVFTELGMSGDCIPDLTLQDNVVVTVLGDGFVPAIDGDRLVLTIPGNEGLVYRAIADEDEIPDTPPLPGPADLLDGTTWELIIGDGPDGPIDPTLASQGPITLSFDLTAGTLGGFDGCNRYGADVEVDGFELEVGVIEAEQEGCEPPVGQRFQDALSQVTDYGFEAGGDQLVLAGGSAELIFELAGDAPDPGSSDAPVVEVTIEGADGVTNGEMSVRVEDISLADASSVVLGETRVGAEGRKVSVTVTGDHAESADLTVSVHLDADEDRTVSAGDWTTDTIYPVLTQGNPTSVTVTLVPVTEGAGGALQTITPSELVDTQPTTYVALEGSAFEAPGGWIMCDPAAESTPFGCTTRWVTMLGFDPLDWSESIAEPIVVTGALDSAGRFAIVPGVRPGAAPAGRFEGFEPTPADKEKADALLQASTQVDVETLRAAEAGVALSLGGEILATLSPAELVDPANWVLDREEFRGYVGPFSALDVAADREIPTDTEILIGPHDHCASPPFPLPDVGYTRQIVLEPTGIDSCLQWFAIDILVDESGDVVAVNLDLWEP